MQNDVAVERLYYDMQIANLKSTITAPPVLTFNDTRNVPIIKNPSDYFLSIIRFQLDTFGLPVFVPVITPKQNDPNQTIYSVTLSWMDPVTNITYTTNPLAPSPVAGGNYSGQVYWIPQNSFQTVPPPPSSTGTGIQYNSDYYYAFNFSYFIYLIDLAFQQAFAQLQYLAVTQGGSANFPATFPPQMLWNDSNGTAVINADVAAYNRTLTNPISIYFNAPLYELFSTFPARNLGYTGVTNGKNYLIIILSLHGGNTIPLPIVIGQPATFTAIQIYQEFSTTALWTPISSIVFCSNTLPVVNNQLSQPLVFDDANQLQTSGNNSNFARIITDISVTDGAYLPSIIYNPTSQYRLLDLFGNTPLNQVDIQVYWKNKSGVLTPFLLNSGCACSIKLLFSKKSST
jgi:hypothetical protein